MLLFIVHIMQLMLAGASGRIVCPEILWILIKDSQHQTFSEMATSRAPACREFL